MVEKNQQINNVINNVIQLIKCSYKNTKYWSHNASTLVRKLALQVADMGSIFAI